MAGIEHNEARILDLTIPLFELEQKVCKLEPSFDSFQSAALNDLTEKIAYKFSFQMKKYLPSVHLVC